MAKTLTSPLEAAGRKANVGITDEQREKAGNLLDRMLSDEYVLLAKTRNYHWNVTGERFIMIHELFDSQVNQLNEMIDETAELARSLGLRALGSLAEFLKVSRLKEDTDHVVDTNVMIANLVSDHEAVIEYLRQQIDVAANDLKLADVADYLTQTIQKHLKIAWFLRAHLD